MNINVYIPIWLVQRVEKKMQQLISVKTVSIAAVILGVCATAYAFSHDVIVAYGDAESHLNIAKRVVQSLTPGAAQLGGIWLPLPHVLMIPFVWLDPLWRSGLAGSFVSGIAFVISCAYLYKTTYIITKNKYASFFSFTIFALNPNILYLQATPMTELVLIMFFILSSYYFIRFIQAPSSTLYLILAAFFGFCATLSRYDGWFLVLFEACVIILMYIFKKKNWKEMEGKLILFATLAFFGIALWMVWDLLILGDPFYFTNSQFSAKSQQQNWLKKGELPAYHNFFMSFAYYFVTAMSNTGIFSILMALTGLIYFIFDKENKKRFYIAIILLVPFIFYVVTLFVGQSVIFIPHLTPVGFEWRLFNVRYGAMMVPIAAFFVGYLFYKKNWALRILIICLFLSQFAMYFVGYSKVITFADGVEGLSQAKRPDAEQWMAKHYDGGLVLLDDYTRTMSILRSNIPMQNVIYIGNKPYWEESFYQPEKYARWIVMQKDDAVWKNIFSNKIIEGRLYKYFNKVYTSPEILIFRRISN